MKTAIIYASMTGHSKKIAQAISTELNIEAHNVVDKPDIDGCDLLLIVSGIYGGVCKPELMAFADALTPKNVKRVALITSSAGKTPQKELRNRLTEHGIAVQEHEYICEGGFLFKGMSHPNKEDIAGAVAFARECIKGGV